MIKVVPLILLIGLVLGFEQANRGVPTSRVTDVFAVKLRPGADADQIAREHGFKNLGQVGTLEGVFRFQKLQAKRGEVFPSVHEHDDVEFAEQQVKRRRFGRLFESINDPMWSRQWNLVGSDVAVNPHSAWAKNYTGQGVQVAIVDDGLDHAHLDISPNYNPVGSTDINYRKSDPSPFAYDTHGTSAAGCAAAKANNNVCGVGTAPNARIAGIRLIADVTSDADEAEGLSYMINVNDIMSSSWGPYDDGARLEGPGPVLMRAFKQGVEQGRGGKGVVYIWAAGNGRAARDNCNNDGYSNNRYTLPVGSIVSGGTAAYYSEPCAALYCVVPSSGGRSGGVSTISVSQRCISSFGGTSAAAPQMAGVVALLLEARPDLTWRDVQHVIAKSAIRNDPSHPDWVVNGGGYHHNHNYGFGRIDAGAVVDVAKNWTLVPPPLSVATVQVNVNQPIQGVEVFGSVNVTSEIDFVEHVDITFQASHYRRGQVEVYAYSPAGTKSILATDRSDYNRDYPPGGWTFGSVRNWGEAASGVWKVSARDAHFSTVGGTFNWFKLTIYGYKKGSAVSTVATTTTTTLATTTTTTRTTSTSTTTSTSASSTKNPQQ